MELYQEYNANFTNFTDYTDYIDYAYPDEHVVRTARNVYIAFAILSAVINTVLLLTVISRAARSCSVCWYMYHLTFVTVIQTIIELVLVFYHNEGVTHVLCVFIHIANLALMAINCYNVILMDIELILTLAPNTNGGEPIRRFLITVIASWSVSVIFSVIVHFVGNTIMSITYDREYCLTVPGIDRTISIAIAQWIPSVIIFVCVCIGCWFFIRSKRQPANYGNGAEDLTNRKLKTELFVFCILWSGFECFQILVLFLVLVGQSMSRNMPYAFIGYMICSLVHFYLPVLCLILGSVRMAVKNALLFVLKN